MASDPALVNWNRWLKLHENQQNQLSHQLKRPPQCLLMNSNFNNLYVNQEKNIITEADKYVFSDKFRGNLNFWKTDNNLQANGKSLGVYQRIQERYDRSNLEQQNPRLMSDREYVGVPRAILEEKGISHNPCLPTSQNKWDTSKYVVEKRELLKGKLKFYQECRPDISNLAIVGVSPVQPVSGFENKTSLNNSEIDIEKLSTPLIDKEDSRQSVSVIIEQIEINENFQPWTLCFENCIVNELYSINMTIKNLRESCLRYSWSLELPHWVDCNLPIKYSKDQRKCFYFDKNNGVILPGCEVTIMFYFQSSGVGVFCETWKLHMSHEPDKWQDKTIEISAVAIESFDCTKNAEAIDSYIDSCTRYTIARKVVEEILRRNRILKQEAPYDWQFFEEQIFIHNNPDLFYDNKMVHILKTLHTRVSKGPWDYSVSNLRRDLFDKSLNKDMSKELKEYSSTIYQLLKPSLPISLLNEKRKSVYELLRSFVSKIDREGANLKHISQNYPTEFTVRSILSDIFPKESKLSAKPSKMSKRLSKYSLNQNRSISKKSKTGNSEVDIDKEICDSNFSLKMNTRKQEYLDAMYVIVYHHLSQTVDQISAIIDSFDSQNKKTVLSSLKDHNTKRDLLLS